MSRFHPARLFWDAAYAAGDHLRHWQAVDPAAELEPFLDGLDLAAGSEVLDVGCGAGAEASLLGRRGVRVLGLDLSLTALALARRHGGDAERARWCCGTVFSLPFADAAFELVLDRGCLHALEPASRRRYGREVARVLEPGGRLWIRGAARDDEEAGLTAVTPEAVARCFPRPRFDSGRPQTVRLEARGEALEGVAVVVRKTRRLP